VLMEVDRGLLFRRLTGRRSCTKCGRIFNIHFSPADTPEHHASCGTDFVLDHRKDDQESVIGNRLDAYEQQTAPLVDYYGARGLLRRVDADGPMVEVFDRLEAAIRG
jgi:adenylate kinase